MSIYRITENNLLVAEYEADNAEVLPSGQIVISDKNGVIGIFNKNCSCYCVNNFYISNEVKRKEYYNKLSEQVQVKLYEIDKNFGNDIFLKDKPLNQQYQELRKIYGILSDFHDCLTIKE